MQNIYKTPGYLRDYIAKMLSNGQRVAVPKNIIEQEGIDVNELEEYFHVREGSFGLMHFTGFKQTA